jgi:hypothetical protein
MRTPLNLVCERGEKQLMKYLAIAVLAAIVIGAILQYRNYNGNPPPPDKESGWMQR